MRVLNKDEIQNTSGANFLPYVLYTIAANQTLSVTDYMIFDAGLELLEALFGG